MLDLNEYNERITIKGKTDEKQPNGEVISTDKEKFSCWAKVIPLSGNETNVGDKDTVKKKFKFRIRHRSDIENTDKLLFNNLELDIISVLPYYKMGRNVVMEIEAEYYN